jgi:hypothetical protein
MDGTASFSVHQAIQRLGTWQMIRSERTINGPEEVRGFDGHTWQQFRQCDMSAEVRQLVEQGNIKLATVVWRRHMLGKFIAIGLYAMIIVRTCCWNQLF